MTQKELTLYQVDAFTGRAFAGNPAAVVPLESWLSDELMQAIAAENNLSETAYFVKQGDSYGLRWFTPSLEVDLCGHATLASAFVIARFLDRKAKHVAFETRSGRLTASLDGDRLTLDFPSLPPTPCSTDRRALVEAALGHPVLELLQALDGSGKLLAVLDSPEAVAKAAPDMQRVAALPGDGLMVSAAGGGSMADRACDFVSRYFAPHAGVDEDPVTGSAHCVLTPYWAEKLDKKRLNARQISRRGGELLCELAGERVRHDRHCGALSCRDPLSAEMIWMEAREAAS